MVIITEPEFLKSTYKNQTIVEKFINYFENENEDTILLIISGNDLDSKVKINSILKSKAKIIKIAAIEGDNLSSWISNRLSSDGYKIDSSALNELIERTEGDIRKVEIISYW